MSDLTRLGRWLRLGAIALCALGPLACGDADEAPFRQVVDREAGAGVGADDPASRDALFLANVERFYARYRLPPGGLTLPDSVGHAAEGFVARLFEQADALASARGDDRMRATDVERAMQDALPQETDARGDLVFFPKLAADERVVVDPLDPESFLRLGMPWRLLRVMLDLQRVQPKHEPDAASARRLADALARYGVLLLRIAGNEARDARGTPAAFVSGAQVQTAAAEIIRRAEASRGLSPASPPATPDLPATPVATTGGADATPLFTDVTREAGIDFAHRSSRWLGRFRRAVPVTPPTFAGGGVAAGDLDGDGRDDLLFVGGGGNVLYHNEGDGHFRRDPRTAQLQAPGRDGLPGEARQPLVADFDNDGREDVFVGYVDAPHRLWRNTGRTFEDVSAEAALGGSGLVVGPAVAFDFDRDGLLDLYLCYYGDYLKSFDPAVVPTADTLAGDLPPQNGDARNGLPNRLFRNVGHMRFEAVADSGTEDTGWCQAATHTDLDGDGFEDLVIANDSGRNRLLRNRGPVGDGPRFEDVSDRLGDDPGSHSRSVAVADLNRDRLPDLFFSNTNLFRHTVGLATPPRARRRKLDPASIPGVEVVETSNLYRSVADGDGRLAGYQDSPTFERGNQLGWASGAGFFDYDADGDEDLYVANGSHASFDQLTARDVKGEIVYGWNVEPNVLYRNDLGTFRIVPPGNGADYAGNSRSVVYLDYDGDGDLDIAVSDFQEPAHLLRNDLAAGASGRHWIRIRLQGDPTAGSNRDAIGARLIAQAPGGTEMWREVQGGSGFESMEPRTQHFGLGKATEVDLDIRWPGGQRQQVKGIAADRTWLIEEGRVPVEVDPGRPR